MSQFIKFYFTSSMLNMFRILIHPSIRTRNQCGDTTEKWLKPATRIPPQPSHTETPTHVEIRTHNQCGDTTEKRLKPATWIPPQPSHTETPTHVEIRTRNQCGDTTEKSQAPDDGCINIRNMLSIEEVK